MKHLFMIQAHTQPLLLKRMIEKLSCEDHYFLIHIDKKQNISIFKDLIKENSHTFFSKKRINVNWGGESQWKATLMLLREGEKLPVKYDYFHFLSDMDYPITNNETIDKFFENCHEKSFMHFDSDQEREKWLDIKYKARLRWNFIDYPIVVRDFFRMIRLGRFMDKFIPRTLPENLYGGWSWFSWNKKVVLWVLDYVKKHPAEIRKFYNGIATDELIFHTILHPYLDELNIEANDSLRYIDWHPTRPYNSLPLVLNETDYQNIISSGKLFCRKVSLPESAILLDMLDIQ